MQGVECSAQKGRKWQLLCGKSRVLWWSGSPDLERGRVARSQLLTFTRAISWLLVLLREKRVADSLQFFFLGFVHVGEGEIEFVQRFDDRRRDGQARKPLVVRRDDVPRGVLRCSVLNHLLVRFLIVLPETALLDVSHGELPALFLRHAEKTCGLQYRCASGSVRKR